MWCIAIINRNVVGNNLTDVFELWLLKYNFWKNYFWIDNFWIDIYIDFRTIHPYLDEGFNWCHYFCQRHALSPRHRSSGQQGTRHTENVVWRKHKYEIWYWYDQTINKQLQIYVCLVSLMFTNYLHGYSWTVHARERLYNTRLVICITFYLV